MIFLGVREHRVNTSHIRRPLESWITRCGYILFFYFFFSFSSASITSSFDQLSQPHFRIRQRRVQHYKKVHASSETCE